MTFLKRAASATVVLTILIVAVLYLPSPISTVAGVILGGFVLLMILPLLLLVIGMVSVFASDDDGGFFDGILEVWFLWSALDLLWIALKWPWIVLNWVFARLWPDAGKKREPAGEPPFDRES